MKNIHQFSIIVIILFVSLNISAKNYRASDHLIEYTGRIDFSNPDAPRFSYSGVSIRACFKGTGISAIMDDEKGENYYTIILDKTQVTKIKMNKGKQAYILAQNLIKGVHEVEIFRSTEQMFGKTSFLGFETDRGTSLVEIPDKRTRMIEFIGNSITCGYGNEGELGATFGASTENHYMTYAAITSRSFNARHLAVCKSGIGIYRNYNGPATGSPDCMPNYYTRIFLYDEMPKYAFKDKPDLICIDLGTNDFSTNGGDSARFVSGYLNFIDSLQHYYTKPDILCLLGPMLNGATLARVRKYIQFVATSANNRGKGNVYFFEMSEQKGDLGIGIDSHPTVAQHCKNGKELVNYISTMKGWPVTPLVLKAEVETPNKITLQFNTEMKVPSGITPGFKIKVDGKQFSVTRTYTDTTDGSKLSLALEELIKPGQKVNLSYEKGQLSGKGNVILESFDNLNVENLMTPNLR
jgi:hypothetical protein